MRRRCGQLFFGHPQLGSRPAAACFARRPGVPFDCTPSAKRHARQLATTSCSPHPEVPDEHRGGEDAQKLAFNVCVDGLRIDWGDGATPSIFHSTWLRHNCAKYRQEHSGQRVVPITEISDKATVVRVESDEPEATLLVEWSDGHRSPYPITWLRAHAYDDRALELTTRSRRTVAWRAQSGDGVTQRAALPQLRLHDVLHSDESAYQWLQTLNRDGFCLVTECGLEPNTVLKLAAVVDPVGGSWGGIYGDVWDVEATPRPINVAYSQAALEYHQDLVYYESPPGLQVLHCLAQAASSSGGESLLVDGVAAAEALQMADRDAFETLCTLPATFQKIHANRSHPVHITYRRPHIQRSHTGQVIAVFWSPPFEGPLAVSAADVPRYYDAYYKFARLIHDGSAVPQVLFKMQPGDVITFNNRRMLHGRTSFTLSQGAKRHLQGTYCGIDEFENRLRVLGLGRAASTDGHVRHVANANML